ncbi:MAG: hypothetical protein HQ513_18310, partial [Rhodospirillales bacterium]|nr:hypothetical protein [Rhodospirillales bacterium]
MAECSGTVSANRRHYPRVTVCSSFHTPDGCFPYAFFDKSLYYLILVLERIRKTSVTYLSKNHFFALITSLLFLAIGPTSAQDINFFRIGTGGTGGTYYPVGGVIAQAISNPPGSRSCEKGGSCGVPGLVAIAQSSNGSVSNIRGIANGTLESGFAQSDTVYWAYSGTGVF